MSDRELMDNLCAYGADMKDAMKRFGNDVGLYARCVRLFAAEKDFPALGEALARADYTEAFELAHSLKGVAANLNLTPLVEPISTMVETLRAGGHDGLTTLYMDIMSEYERLKLLAS